MKLNHDSLSGSLLSVGISFQYTGFYVCKQVEDHLQYSQLSIITCDLAKDRPQSCPLNAYAAHSVLGTFYEPHNLNECILTKLFEVWIPLPHPIDGDAKV